MNDDFNHFKTQATNERASTENEFFYSAIAFVFTTLGSFFTALSFTLMKFSINRDQRFRWNRPAYKQGYWMIGFCLIFVSIAFNALALDYGNILLLSSSSSITMVFNMIMATYFLKEYFNKKWDTLAIILIIFGSAICLSFSKNNSESDKLTERQLFMEFTTSRSVAYITLIYCGVTCAFFYNKFIIKRLSIQHESLMVRH